MAKRKSPKRVKVVDIDSVVGKSPDDGTTSGDRAIEIIEVDLNWFNGKGFKLTGVDETRVGDASAILFVLDGKVYRAEEDPSDGYRSSLGSISVLAGAKVKNTFAPVVVKASYVANDSRNTVLFRDAETDDIVLEIGTDQSNDYYPSYVANFEPKAMTINREALRAEREMERKKAEIKAKDAHRLMAEQHSEWGVF